MLFIFSTPAFIRHLWQLKAVVFLHWCLICPLLLGVCQIHWNYAHIIFLTGSASQEVLNKDPTVWLDGARPPPNKSNYEFDREARKLMGENLKLVLGRAFNNKLGCLMMCMYLCTLTHANIYHWKLGPSGHF